MASQPSPQLDDPEFEQALAQVEKSWRDLQQRYTQVKRDQQRKLDLQQRRVELQEQQKNGSREHIKTQLKHLEQELENLELNLETRLFRWSSLKEPFWQAVRFGGLGVVLGWILKSCAG